ncbi:NADH dehydrogenase [ubiquinone] 1 alpha subcomplex subunit 5-like [Glossophaga mutica]
MSLEEQRGGTPLFGAVVAGLLKKTTGLVGLVVCLSPHERLRILHTKILDILEQIPKNAAYRKYTEQVTNERLGMVKAEPDVKKLEDQIQAGQIEEAILQAESERSLAGKMIQWKPWEPLAEEPPAGRWKWPIKSSANDWCVKGKLMSLKALLHQKYVHIIDVK